MRICDNPCGRIKGTSSSIVQGSILCYTPENCPNDIEILELCNTQKQGDSYVKEMDRIMAVLRHSLQIPPPLLFKSANQHPTVRKLELEKQLGLIGMGKVPITEEMITKSASVEKERDNPIFKLREPLPDNPFDADNPIDARKKFHAKRRAERDAKRGRFGQWVKLEVNQAWSFPPRNTNPNLVAIHVVSITVLVYDPFMKECFKVYYNYTDKIWYWSDTNEIFRGDISHWTCMPEEPW